MNDSAPGRRTIGALTRYRMLERDPATARDLPLIAEALPHIAHPQIRNRGTIGGNLAHADPASEMPAIVMALGGPPARAVGARRTLARRAGFFCRCTHHGAESDEMLTGVELPVAGPGSGSCFMEVSRRRGDFALIGVAVACRVDDGGTCTAARIGLCNAGDGPVFAADASASLVGRSVGTAEIREAADLVQSAIDPGGSIHASKEFQRHLAGVLTTRALTTANQRARREH